ncbi:MAG: hypothetical protein E4H14_10710 [Candidatus Thorarchaeota archaeon]|nr:MAG: hypothetical protein E4H14_10710 [Candidatus Thorarchaeota archaeon]
MNVNENSKTLVLTSSSIALVVTQLFRLLFGGYLIAFDQFFYNDLESASSVFGIYVIIGIFTTLFLMGKKKWGLIGLVAISAILLVMQSIYLVVFFTQTTPDPSLHDPVANWWSTMLYYVFALLTFVYAIKVRRET